MIPSLALGAAAGADRTAVGQTLLAQPVVAASLAGWLVGAPAEGIWLGLSLGLYEISRPPVGRPDVRDWTSIAIAIPAALGPGHPAWTWGFALLMGLALGPVVGVAITAHRDLSRRWWPAARDRAIRDPGALERFQLGLAGLHLLRGAVVVGLTALVLRGGLVLAERGLDEAARQVLTWAWRLAPLYFVPAALAGRRWGWFAVGLLAGGALGVWGVGR